MDSDPSLQDRTAAHLCLVLDRIDEFEKVPLLARVFAAYMRSRINVPQMRRLIAMLDRVTVTDLYALRDFIQSGTTPPLAAYYALESAGLALVDHSIIRPRIEGETRGTVQGIHFVLSPTAKLLVEIAF